MDESKRDKTKVDPMSGGEEPEAAAAGSTGHGSLMWPAGCCRGPGGGNSMGPVGRIRRPGADDP
jgi:hypothetical protein